MLCFSRVNPFLLCDLQVIVLTPLTQSVLGSLIFKAKPFLK
jgi:hypothetical protein